MKKLFFFLSAFALLGMATACVEQLQVNNPNYNAERDEVKTDFTINIAGPVATKATAATAQATTTNQDGTVTGAFRGMSDMTLFVLKGDPAATTNAADFESTNYPLGTLGTTDISATQSSKIYNLTFPTGVKNMVFYAKAAKENDVTDAANGKISWPSISSSTRKTNMVFGLTPIVEISENSNPFNTAAAPILTVLNNVVRAFGGVTDDGYDANLKKAYDLFTKINGTELRLGSAPAIKRMLTDLKKTMTNLKTGASSTVAGICDAVITAIGTTPETIVTENEDPFPTNLGLPEGAAQLTFADGQFSYVQQPGTLTNTSATAINKFAYPVELCYWVSSDIRTSTDPDITADMYPKTVATWDSWTSTATGWAGKWVSENATINAATRAVALKKNIQYANALMKTTIAYTDNVTKLKDNNAANHPNTGEVDNTIDVSNTAFTVKGILVGKQPAQVGWTFKDEAATTHDYVIYDHVFNATAIPTTNPLYTMVFDNYTTVDDDKVVNIAVELVNNSGKDFWGKDNLIPAGGTFYLTAELKLGSGDNFASVFMQDYVTTVKLTIGEKSLQKAYATVPDLRSVAMTFGLSVDLTWQSGKEFNIELGNQPSGN